jgi:NAD(P)-dependent dehydrogenase (short-subunit alcohol dehydrogenase family)
VVRMFGSTTYDFRGRVALIAGASRGIGAEAAKAFARAGATVVITARSAEPLAGVADEIEAAGGTALSQAGDLTDAEFVRDLVDETIGRFGRLDAAFNNATGGTMPAPLAELDIADFDGAVAGNIRSTFLGCKYQIPAMLKSGGGAVVNMASVAGVIGTANLAAYTAGKAGIIALTRVAALDYADAGVRVNVVAPGPILTHHLERAGSYAQQQAAKSVPMGRTGTVAEVAATVLWLCSDAASFITGAVIPLDGGQTAGYKPPQMYRPGERMQPEHAAD